MKKRSGIIMGSVIAIIIICIIVCSVWFAKSVWIDEYTYRYQKTNEILYNPMMGFAPAANYTKAVGDNTLVYVQISWRELEPEEGKFDFQEIEQRNQLEKWRKEGKKVVLRFVCDIPSDEEHMDIPDWLYDQTGDGTFYDGDYGKGYSPDYTNSVFIEAHKKAIEALGKEYGQDTFFYYIELGSLGHWGEWHVKYDEGIRRFPSEEICAQYVEPYVTYFPNAKLLMRRPFSFVTTYHMGVYNDMTGAENDTSQWLEWLQNGGTYSTAEKPITLQAVPEIWESSPVGGEFTSTYSMEEMLTTRLTETLNLLAQTHMSFIGPNCPIANEELIDYPDEVEKVLENIGYRYRIAKVHISMNRLTNHICVKMQIENDGVAPIYENWPLILYEMDDQGNPIERHEVQVDLTKLLGGESRSVEIEWKASSSSMPQLAIGIEDPSTMEPAVALDMDTDQVEKYYYLNK